MLIYIYIYIYIAHILFELCTYIRDWSSWKFLIICLMWGIEGSQRIWNLILPDVRLKPYCWEGSCCLGFHLRNWLKIVHSVFIHNSTDLHKNVKEIRISPALGTVWQMSVYVCVWPKLCTVCYTGLYPLETYRPWL